MDRRLLCAFMILLTITSCANTKSYSIGHGVSIFFPKKKILDDYEYSASVPKEFTANMFTRDLLKGSYHKINDRILILFGFYNINDYKPNSNLSFDKFHKVRWEATKALLSEECGNIDLEMKKTNNYMGGNILFETQYLCQNLCTKEIVIVLQSPSKRDHHIWFMSFSRDIGRTCEEAESALDWIVQETISLNK